MIAGVRDMTAADVAPLDALLRAAYATSRSYERRLRDAFASQAARTFVVDGDDGPVGMATLHDYVTLGYVALVGVAPQQQRRGIGWRLMQAVMADSRERNHQTLALESSVAGRALYDRLGFQTVGATLAMEGPAASPPVEDVRIRCVTPDDRDILGAYDAAAFGGDRSATIRRWFARTDATIIIADDGDHIGGYAVMSEGRLAPWMAQSPGAAALLFDAARNAARTPTARAWIPEENFSALAIASKRGWKPYARNVHMVRGLPLHFPRRDVYGLISLGEG